jgi:hypothetical protein
MPTTISSLSSADQSDFTKRLGLFGLDTSAITQPDLVVPSQSKLTLSTAGPSSFTHPHILVSKNLDDVKKWIGIPDTYFQKGTLPGRAAPPPLRLTAPVTAEAPAPRVAGLAAASTLAAGTAATAFKLASADLDTVRRGAISYIWGDSTQAASYKTIAEQHFGEFQISIWPFFTIFVSAGSTLQLGPGNNVLCAWKIVIQEGGAIVSTGGLTVQCTILQKTIPLLLHPIFSPSSIAVG